MNETIVEVQPEDFDPLQTLEVDRELVRKLKNGELSEKELKDIAEYATASPLAFARFATGTKYQWADHLDLIDRALMDLETGRNHNLVVCAPPQHGKSELITRFGFTWHMCRNPDDRGVIASYSSKFAAEWGRQTRDLVIDFGVPFFGVRLSKDNRGISQWGFEGREGMCFTCGIQGSATGRRGNWMILDDPVKGSAEAYSEVFRENVWQWLVTTFFTRVAPTTRTIVLLTRWHTDDVVARILSTPKASEFQVISLPAFCVDPESDLMNRELGAPLWPWRFSKEWLETQRDFIGIPAWSSLYQQSPIPLGDEVFDVEQINFIEKEDLPEDLTWHRYWDLAISEKEESSYTASVRVAIDKENKVYIDDAIRGKWTYPRQKQLILATAAREGPRTRIGVEKAQHGAALVQDLTPDIHDMGISIKPIPVDKDKLTRSIGAQNACNSGKMYMVRDPKWNEILVNELAFFPRGRYDDQVDSVSGGWAMAKGMRRRPLKVRHIDF